MNILNTICSMETSTPEANFENLRLAIKLANQLRDKITSEITSYNTAINDLEENGKDYSADWFEFKESVNLLNIILNMESNNE